MKLKMTFKNGKLLPTQSTLNQLAKAGIIREGVTVADCEEYAKSKAVSTESESVDENAQPLTLDKPEEGK